MSIKLKVHKSVEDSNLVGIVRISPEAEKIVKQLVCETGLSALSIVSQIVIQAADQIEVQEV